MGKNFEFEEEECGEEYLELYLPEYLEEDIKEFKRLVEIGDTSKASGYWCEVYSSINIAETEDEITTEQAWYLRKKYLGLRKPGDMCDGID